MKAFIAKPFISIAPMEGVVDWIVRDLLTKIGGIDRAVTEFVRVTDRVLPDHVFLRYCPELQTGGRTAAGTPVYVQLLGGNPELLAQNATGAERLGAPGIDLNFGCPARTVNRHDGGATLLKLPERLYNIITAVKAAVRVPVSAKVRLGFENKDLHLDIARAVDRAGASLLTIHARTKIEGYTPPAHWKYIARMRDAVRVPILANGDIWTIDDYRDCARVTGIPDVALGRGLVGRPDLARQIRDGAAPLEWNEILDLYARPFFSMSLESRGEAFAVARAKQLLKFLSRGFPEARALFEVIKVFHSADDVRRVLFGKEELCHTFRFTPETIALSASAPRIY